MYFEPTEKFNDLVEAGVFIVLDECQAIKNNSLQYKATRALFSVLFNATHDIPSRALMLSGSPMDKEVHVFNFTDLFGITNKNHVGDAPRDNASTQAEDIKRYCKSIDPELTAQVIASAPSRKAIPFQLFQSVIKPALTSAMTPGQYAARLYKFTGMFDIKNPRDYTNIVANVRDFQEHVNEIVRGDKVIVDLGVIARLMHDIENDKLHTFVRLALQELRWQQRSKVVLCFNYTDNIFKTCKALEQYNPLVIYGKTTNKQRRECLELFQRPDTEHRVLIVNSAVCSTGIDLDDKHGGFPRTVFISPNFNIIQLYQLGHRFLRFSDTKSSTRMYMVFASHASEARIIKKYVQKGGILKETCHEQEDAGVVFPGDFDIFEEASGEVKKNVNIDEDDEDQVARSRDRKRKR